MTTRMKTCQRFPHYYIVVHALDAVDVASLGLDKNTTPALLGFNLFNHTLGRGMIVPWYEVLVPGC
jgi:phosphatidylethanolamine-binding protein (PEBP) family uncharacterized protein